MSRAAQTVCVRKQAGSHVHVRESERGGARRAAHEWGHSSLSDRTNISTRVGNERGALEPLRHATGPC